MKHIRKEVEAEKDLIVHSGELPEVAFHESLYFLTESSQGPKLMLTSEELKLLKEAVVQGYHRIILRDLNPENRAKSIFRGIDRVIVNLKRLKRFSQKEKMDIKHLLPEMAKALRKYLAQELNDAELKRKKLRTINCTLKDWQWLCAELGISLDIPKAFFERKALSFKETIDFFKHRQRGP